VTIGVLRAANEALSDEVAQLKALLSADSSTTSKPPSGDGAGARKKRAERRADARASTERSQGKQPGAAGKTLERRRPECRVDHEPPACHCCGADLTGAEVVGNQICQVIDRACQVFCVRGDPGSCYLYKC
jgi:transposase